MLFESYQPSLYAPKTATPVEPPAWSVLQPGPTGSPLELPPVPARSRFEPILGHAPQSTLGHCVCTGEPIVTPFDEFLESCLVLGRSGSGKSKLLQAMIRDYRSAHCPVVVIDAEGDLVEDNFADQIDQCRQLGTEAPLAGVHVLRPSWDVIFGFDPFDDRHVPGDPMAHRAWLHTRVTQMRSAILRSQNEMTTEGMPRLERILTDVLWAIGMSVGPNGARLPLANVFILIQPEHPRHDEVYAIVAPHLPSEIRADFEHLAKLRHDERLRQTESTINRLRSFLSPLVMAMLSSVRDKSVDLCGIIADRGLVLVNLKDTEYFAPEQADVLGRTFIYLVISAVRSLPRTERLPCALVVDECQRFLNRDILIGLAQGRKWGLGTILATQTLVGLDVVEEHFGQVVLGTVNVTITFEQRLPRDLDVLADYVFRPNLSFEEMYVEVDRHKGYRLHHSTDYSESWQTAVSWADAHATAWSLASAFSRGRGLSRQQSDATAHSGNVSNSRTHSDSQGLSEGSADGIGEGQSIFEGQAPLVVDGQLQGLVATSGAGSSHTATHVDSRGRSATTTDGASHSESRGLAHIVGRVLGVVDNSSASTTSACSGNHSQVRGGTTSRGRTIAYRSTPLAIVEPEWQPQGRLRRSVDDQFEAAKTLLATLPRRHAVIRRNGQRTRIFRVVDVHDPFPDPAFKEALIREYERKLHALHDYYLTGPRIDALALDGAVDDFLAKCRVPEPVTSTSTAPSHPFR